MIHEDYEDDSIFDSALRGMGVLQVQLTISRGCTTLLTDLIMEGIIKYLLSLD